jgi:hypothetical protein
MTVQSKPIDVVPQSHGHAPTEHGSDAEVGQQVREHHAAMVAELDRLIAALRDAEPTDQEATRAELAGWFDEVLVPHADEEEVTTYRAASQLTEGRALIEAMAREHLLIKRLVALFTASEATAAAYGRAVFEAFTSHQGKENDVILPMLVDAPDASLVAVMGGAHGHQVGEELRAHAHH